MRCLQVAQVCAYVLGVDVSDVVVKPTLSLTAPNTAPTGGSGGSESAVYVSTVQSVYITTDCRLRASIL